MSELRELTYKLNMLYTGDKLQHTGTNAVCLLFLFDFNSANKILYILGNYVSFKMTRKASS